MHLDNSQGPTLYDFQAATEAACRALQEFSPGLETAVVFLSDGQPLRGGDFLNDFINSTNDFDFGNGFDAHQFPSIQSRPEQVPTAIPRAIRMLE